MATSLAKGVAEHSRNAVAGIREFRLQVETALGQGLRRRESRQQDPTLGDLVELVLATNRAREQAREAVREGMWAWRTAPAEYHAQRRLMDSTLPSRSGERLARRRKWMITLDAGVRRCRELERLLGEEIEHSETLMRLVSTVAASRDAQAQETFNLVAAIGGIGGIAIGLTALLLSLLRRRFDPAVKPPGLADLCAARVRCRPGCPDGGDASVLAVKGASRPVRTFRTVERICPSSGSDPLNRGPSPRTDHLIAETRRPCFATHRWRRRPPPTGSSLQAGERPGGAPDPAAGADQPVAAMGRVALADDPHPPAVDALPHGTHQVRDGAVGAARGLARWPSTR